MDLNVTLKIRLSSFCCGKEENILTRTALFFVCVFSLFFVLAAGRLGYFRDYNVDMNLNVFSTLFKLEVEYFTKTL